MRGLRLFAQNEFRFYTSRFQASRRSIVLGIFRALADFIIRLGFDLSICLSIYSYWCGKLKNHFS
jgi:hypothetical protein